MEQIRIVYIDDKPDTDLDEYFDRHYVNEEYKKNYELIPFDPHDSYESLLQDYKGVELWLNLQQFAKH